ncbi:MAG: type II toxin-antitoxin system VapC family toxin [Armatimonadota bacterium]
MTAFADTSALIAFLDAAGARHAEVAATWAEFARSDGILVTTNYVVVEALAVCQRRFGTAGARRLLEHVVPGLAIEWVDQDAHEASAKTLLTTNRRDLSFIDVTSFHTMRRLGITCAFALDERFREQGFEVVP